MKKMLRRSQKNNLLAGFRTFMLTSLGDAQPALSEAKCSTILTLIIIF